MTVRKITQEQKELLEGNNYTVDSFFHCCEDADGNFFISNEEVNMCDVEAFLWVRDLPEIEYKPKLFIL